MLAHGVVAAAKSAVDSSIHEGHADALLTENALLGQLFEAPAATELTRAALRGGAQTHDVEVNLEHLLVRLAR